MRAGFKKGASGIRVDLEPLGEGASKAETSFLQAKFWSRFKADFGWRGLALRIRADFGEYGDPAEGELRVLVRNLAGPLCFAYVPGGPALPCPEAARTAFLAALSRSLSPLLPSSCIFIRFDPPWFHEESREASKRDPAPLQRPTLGPPLRKAGSDVQPPDTVLLDIGKGDDELLAGMKPKWRYNIRLAEKKQVSVIESGSEGLEVFYALYEATARRDRIAIHPRSYYERLFALCATEGVDLRLWTARHEGEAIAAIITLFHGRTGTYLYGASSDAKRSLMPAYALQWSALRAAREAGCDEYDFYGIPPTDSADHPMAGLYRFKTGFGGRVVHFAGSWDLPLRPALYLAWQFAEALRAYWYKRIKKGLSALAPARRGGEKAEA